MELKKFVRLGTVQICTLKKSVILFRKLDSGLWEQAQALDNNLAYMLPTEKPLVLYLDEWLDSDKLTLKLSKLKRGIYKPE